MFSFDFACHFGFAVTRSIYAYVHPMQAISGKQKGVEKIKLA